MDDDKLKSLQEELDLPDDSLAEIKEIAPQLKTIEQRYLYWRSMALPPREAYLRAGYKGNNWRTVETRPAIRKAIADLAERLLPEYRVTRESVIGIIMEGVDIARRKDQAKNMIEGALALADITGLKSPQQVQLDYRVQIEREQTRALRHMPRTGLEQMVGVQRTLPTPVIEGEYVVQHIERVEDDGV
jgi:hypothetical protein